MAYLFSTWGMPALGKEQIRAYFPSLKAVFYAARVRHIKFGEGTVKSIKDGGKDYEVTVVFDTAGQKKMFASFAKLTKA